MPINSQGMTIQQTATYQLTSIEADNFAVQSVVAQTAANQTIDNPGMPGMKMNVKKMTGTGKGEVHFDQTKVLPLQGKVNSQSDTAMTMNTGGGAQAMNMKMDMDITLESK